MRWTSFGWALVALGILAGAYGSGGSSLDKKADQGSETRDPTYLGREVEESAWKQIDRIYGEAFGEVKAPGLPDDIYPLFGREKPKATTPQPGKSTDARGRSTDAIIALVPDPVESHLEAQFDQVVSGIQRAFAARGFQLERFWLPWPRKPNDPPSHLDFPGLLLFRHKDGSKLLSVFLVGENTKQGVLPGAFQTALRLASLGAPGARLGILGPNFSGSAPSLIRELRKKTDLGAVSIVSGSATSGDLPELFRAARLPFERTVLPDDILQKRGFEFLVRKLGWDLDEAALLYEGDTAYGNAFASLEPSGSPKPQQGSREPRKPREDSGKSLWPKYEIRFPSGIAELRSEWSREAEADPDKGFQGITLSSLLRNLHPVDLHLATDRTPGDVVPQFGTTSTATTDLALGDVLRVGCGGSLRYLGIVATDTRDKLALARRVRERCPRVELFTFGSDLLTLHPDAARDLEGLIVITPSPMATQGRTYWQRNEPPTLRDGQDEQDDRKERAKAVRKSGLEQFASDIEEGTFVASLRLADRLLRFPLADAIRRLPAADRLRLARHLHLRHGSAFPAGDEQIGRSGFDRGAWPRHLLNQGVARVAVVGNGSLWPLAVLGSRSPSLDSQRPPLRDLFPWSLAVLLLLSAFAYRRVVERTLASLGFLEVQQIVPIALGYAALGACGAILLSVGLCSLFPILETAAFSALAGRSAAYAILGAIACLWAGRRRPLLRLAAGALLIAAAVALLVWRLLVDWMPGGSPLFLLRLNVVASYVSPIPSIFLIAAALALWAAQEIERIRLTREHGVTWKLEGSNPQYVYCATYARRIDSFVRSVIPPHGMSAGVVLVTAFLAVQLYLAIQPVAESVAYGWVFATLLLAVATLAACSFVRFVLLWTNFKEVLERLRLLGFERPLGRQKDEIDWKPMRAFAQRPVTLRITWLTLKAAKTIEASAALKGSFPLDFGELDRLESDLVEAQRSDDLQKAFATRQKLQSAFDTILCRYASTRWFDRPEVVELASLRSTAFFRHVISQMRASLVAAILPGFLLLAATASYAFQPKGFVFMSLWLGLLVAALRTLWTLVDMDRDSVLSAVGGTKPGEVEFTRSFVSNALTYGIAPLIGLALLQFPQLGSYVGRLLAPFHRILPTLH